MADGKGMGDWFERHGSLIQGLASIAAVLVAVAALIGVKVQIDAAARLQQEQSARDIYREYLNLSIAKPEFADPDYCAIKGSNQDSAYSNYVDYMLYTSEQLLAVSPEWEGAMAEHWAPHAPYLCSVKDWSQYPDSVTEMMNRARPKLCNPAPSTCPPKGGDER